MFQDLQESQIEGAIEALLFVTDEPVNAITLADMLEVEVGVVTGTLAKLQNRFEEEKRGIQLREVAGGWRLYTHSVYRNLIERYVLSWDTRKLSQAAMETLAIVAYLQPITRAGVASVRGVNSDSSINSLVEKGLLREAGSADTPGNPTLYATTRVFLEKFGLRSTADLPDLEQFAPSDEARSFIRERLSAPRGEVHILEDMNTDKEAYAFEKIPDSEGVFNINKASTDSREFMAEAFASSMGLTEKIDFDRLVFETDDE